MPSIHEEICDGVVCRCECVLCLFGEEEEPELKGLRSHYHVCSSCGEQLRQDRTGNEHCEECEGIDP